MMTLVLQTLSSKMMFVYTVTVLECLASDNEWEE